MNISKPESMPKKDEIYRHFKSPDMIYKVHGPVFNASIDEWYILYEPMYNTDIGLCVRSANNWFDEVNRDGYVGPRFIKMN